MGADAKDRIAQEAAPDAPQTPRSPRVNRRNHYRLLHVQPEAPLEVIRASYRTLMMRLHPDKGGDAQQAALINEAYAVLSDPEQRAAYDRQLRQRVRPEAMRRGTGMAGSPAVAAAHRYADVAQDLSPHAGGTTRLNCAFCGAGHPGPHGEAPTCRLCGAPLTPVKMLVVPNFGGSGLNRRGSTRRGRQHEAVAYWGSPPQRHVVRWRDLSASGLSLWTPTPLGIGQRLHLVDQDIQTVAEVVSCDAREQGCLVRAKLLTLKPTRRAGVFYNGQA